MTETGSKIQKLRDGIKIAPIANSAKKQFSMDLMDLMDDVAKSIFVYLVHQIRQMPVCTKNTQKNLKKNEFMSQTVEEENICIADFY